MPAIKFPCPTCGASHEELEFYDEQIVNGLPRGRYRCKCGRDTVWGQMRALSVNEMMADVMRKMGREEK